MFSSLASASSLASVSSLAWTSHGTSLVASGRSTTPPPPPPYESGSSESSDPGTTFRPAFASTASDHQEIMNLFRDVALQLVIAPGFGSHHPLTEEWDSLRQVGFFRWSQLAFDVQLVCARIIGRSIVNPGGRRSSGQISLPVSTRRRTCYQSRDRSNANWTCCDTQNSSTSLR